MLQLALLAFLLSLAGGARGLDDARQDAFINYSEVARVQEDVNPADVVAVAVQSSYGQIRLHLRRDWAPNAAEAVARAAAGKMRACPGCSWYRHEPAPENWGVNGFYGPPYGLLQGGIPVLETGVTQENPGARAVTRGTAAFIAGSTDYFIGTVDHTEWGAAFTVFAQVEEEDMKSVVPLIPLEPYRNSTDAYNFTTRWLLERVPVTLVPLTRKDLLAGGGASGAGAGTA
ncbi:hypothetical protein HYH03_017089 [Edaphochlamys debaryana]|uniref:Peptidylprolyl isomerase n=1 Tax=Edaphochlamys debaryana TaxID=47281 RepID=A0A835XNB0_9CHLO|nr:hypothetical protein HYH03_017089 [Edaphochlamys debaryana]|eukprot:KAG2484070.1 hypothetical protein HYH03_017089 [Edaphochlamys debaryana]